MNKKEWAKKYLPIVITVVSIFTFIVILSFNMTYNSDEYNYSNITWTNDRISSIGDIFKSQKILYLNWTGRVIIHFIIQLLIYMGAWAYPIFNAIVFVLFIYCIMKLADMKINAASLICAALLVWLFQPVFGETVMWLSGSVNYLWATTMLLFTIYFYKNIYRINSYLFIAIIAFLSGFIHENIIFVVMSFIFYNLILNRENLKKKIVYIVGFIIGSAFLLLSPGNLSRTAAESTMNIKKFMVVSVLFIVFTSVFFVLNSNKLKNNIDNFIIKYNKIVSIITYIIIPIFTLVIFFIDWRVLNLKIILEETYFYLFIVWGFMFFNALTKSVPYEKILEAINLLIISLVALLPMIMMGSIVRRSFFASWTLIIISTLILFRDSFKEMKIKYISLISLIIVSPTIIIALKFYSVDLGNWKSNLEASIDRFRKLNSDTAVVEVQPTPYRIIYRKYCNTPTPILANENAISNYYMASYYGFNNVVGIKADSIVIRLKIENGDKNNIILKTSDKVYENISIGLGTIEPTREVNETKEVYFEIPSGLSSVTVENIGDESIAIDDISYYTLNNIRNYNRQSLNKIISVGDGNINSGETKELKIKK